jgi:hypothetical protein
MKFIFLLIANYSIKTVVGLWDFLFFFFGFTYEKQAGKLDLDKMDPLITGPKNEKTGHQFFRANKVGKDAVDAAR